MKDEDILELLRTARDPDPARVLDALVRASGAERGFLALGEGEGFSILTARNMEPPQLERAGERPSRTLLERALREGRPLSATDADLEGVTSLREQKVRSVAVLPLRSYRGAVVLDSRRKGLFRDLDQLDRIAGELDRALDQAGRGELVGHSPSLRELRRLLDKVAAAPYPVLLCGESGTGKELAARAIHRRSSRARGPFVATNCSALPETLLESELFGHTRGAFTGADRDHPGLFEQAHGGTLFLDEAACLSPGAQESLLRVLETGEVRRVGASRTATVDVRIVAATNENLETSVSFRRDLFYRLDVLRVNLPPLRERMEDLPLLAEHFLERIARETASPRRRLAPPALAALARHPWPGNVRELENALRRAVALSESDVLEAEDFAFLRGTPAPAEAEAPILSINDYIRSTLERWEGRMPLAEIAARLGVSRKTLWMKRKAYGP